MIFSRCDTVYHPLGQAIAKIVLARSVSQKSNVIKMKEIVSELRSLDPYRLGKKTPAELWTLIVHLSTVTTEIVLPNVDSHRCEFSLSQAAISKIGHLVRLTKTR